MINDIEIKNLSKIYGKSRGIKHVNLNIERGTVFGFIGPNGAGKSTTIRCIMHMINSSYGQVLIDDKEISDKNYKLKEEIGYLPSEIHLYEDLTVKKMIEYSASFYKKDCSKKAHKLIRTLEIDTSKKIDELSLGNLKKVGIVLSLMHDPEFIIMDEATSGLDPLMQEKFYEILEEEKKNGKTIFFSSHILSEVKRICDFVAIIKDGQIVSIEDISNFEKSNYIKVKIISDDIVKIKQAIKMENVISKEDNKIEFTYSQDINNLIFILSRYKLTKLIIEELSIEDLFMHYYE